jgi:hypothetical protein
LAGSSRAAGTAKGDIMGISSTMVISGMPHCNDQKRIGEYAAVNKDDAPQ